MTTTRLTLYNDALMIVGERALSALTDTVEMRYLLDQVWTNNGVDGCLEEGQWYFAMRADQIDYDTGITPPFGFSRAFDKPTDWIRTSSLCSDESFLSPLLQYTDESGYWYADLDTIYVKYVSNHASYGGNLAVWPRSFTDFVAAHFASKIVLKLSSDEKRRIDCMALRERLLKSARSKAAMAEPTVIPPSGSWSRARMRGGSRRDGGGNTGNLY